MIQTPLKYYGKLTINPGSWQQRGLTYWVSPWLEQNRGFGQVERYKHVNDTTFSYMPLMVADPDMGWVYDIDTAERGYKSRRLVMDYITCSAWIKGGNQASDANVILGDDTGPNRNFQFRITTNALQWIIFKRAGGFNLVTGSTTSLNNNTWRHIAATYDGAQLRVFVDGKEDATPVADAGLLNNSTGHYYFFGASTGFYYVGRNHDYRIYNRALSAEEIFALYDTKTRWDLYLPVKDQFWSIPAAAPPAGNPWYAYAQQ